MCGQYAVRVSLHIENARPRTEQKVTRGIKGVKGGVFIVCGVASELAGGREKNTKLH